jgi:hypothetical protein
MHQKQAPAKMACAVSDAMRLALVIESPAHKRIE